MDKLVSIVICTYNRAASLNRTLYSLKHLHYKKFEVVVIAGPCTDNTNDVLLKYERTIKIAHNPHKNLSISRNMGIRMSAGDIIAFIDDDAIPDRYWLNDILSMYTDKSIGGVGGKVFAPLGTPFMFERGVIDIWGQADDFYTREDCNDPKGTKFNIMLGTNCTFTKEALLAVNGFDEYYDYFNDESDLCVRVIKAGYKIIHHPQAYIHHEFAKSHIRKDNEGIRLNWFPIAKNTVYFILKNSRGLASYREQEKNLERVKSRFLEILRRWQQDGRLSEIEANEFIQASEEGFKVGYNNGRNDNRLLGIDLDGGSDFLQYDSYNVDTIYSICLLCRDNILESTSDVAKHTYELAKGYISAGHIVHIISGGDEDQSWEQEGLFIHSATYIESKLISKICTKHISLKSMNYSYLLYKKIEQINAKYGLDIVEGELWNFERVVVTRLLEGNLPVVVQSPPGLEVSKVMIETNLENYSKLINKNVKQGIPFGTGGLRGIMGVGYDHLNHYTVQQITQGLVKTILEFEAPKRVGVAFDTRHNSAEFAETVCEVLSAYGIEVYCFDKPMPTPILSYAIRYMKLGWGVVITASHNPKEYNGYKVYDCNGVQVTDTTASKIAKSINTVGVGEPISKVQNDNMKKFDESIVEEYIEQVVSFVQSKQEDFNFSFIYSALHGAGASAVPNVLIRMGFSPICIQQEPDGDYGGLVTPNPEEPGVYEKALIKARENNAKLILATDPDCDRVGVMEKTEDGFELLSGNQIGALLIDYLVQTRGVSKEDHATSCGVVISTIVSGLLGELVAREFGLEFVRLLTGFKYIGEHIVNLPENKHFFFGYEESYGYLAGDGAKDKDAVIASALIVKMVAFYNSKGITLLDRWHELSEKHGYCLESLLSINVSKDAQKDIMSKLRAKLSVEGVTRSEDYVHGLNGLPPADVIKLYFTGDGNTLYNTAWVAVRPSGTEPKLKLYFGVHAKSYETAKVSLEKLKDRLLKELEI
jgi:phosphomannomutase/glycosyltransferase involved in cell wall biosynthesis